MIRGRLPARWWWPRGPGNARSRAGVLFAAGALALALGPLRGVLEAGMATHMLVQFPLLIAAGLVLAGAFPPRPSARIPVGRRDWNHLGIAGLAFAVAVLAVSMIPRLLDLALFDVRVEALKLIALFMTGALLRWSWPKAGLIVQGFFLGNVLPMTAVVGILYRDSPVRLCNNYRFDEQWLVGTMLVVLALVAGAAWLVFAGCRMHRAEMALR